MVSVIDFTSTPAGTDAMTFDEILTRIYLIKRPHLAAGTIDIMRRELSRWSSLMPGLGPTQIDRDTLIQFRDICVERKLAGSTINNNLDTIVKLLKAAGLAIDDQEIKLPHNQPGYRLTLEDFNRVWQLTDQAAWPSMTRNDKRTLKSSNYAALRCDSIPGAWWRALLMLAYSTGLKRHDLFRLRWDQVHPTWIEVKFPNGARPKLLPIPEPLKPWLDLLRKNETESILGRTDAYSFDKEVAHLRRIAGVEQFCLEAIRYLSASEWDRASKGCGNLILRHKLGDSVSGYNYLRLSTAAKALRYPINAETSSPGEPPVLPRPRAPRSSLAKFNAFFSSGSDTAPESRISKDALSGLTLREVFDSSLREILETDDCADSTMRSYQLALSHWERLTDNPSVANITTQCLQAFRKAAKADSGYSAASWNCWFRTLRAVLNHLGPCNNSSSRARAALSFYQRVPWLDNLKEETPAPSHLDDDQINRLYQHCLIAEWPPKSRTGCQPVDWWRCALVIMVNYGPRLRDWFHLKTQGIFLEKDYLTLGAKKTGKRQYLVFNDTVKWHLQRIPFAEREFVFSPTQTLKQLYRQWNSIQAAADVADHNGSRYKFKAVRATAGSRYHEYFPGTAQLLLGHAVPRELSVTARHYLGSALIKPLLHAIRNIPQPASFSDAVSQGKSIGATENE